MAVRFHEGRYHGADGWPPGPGRLFQALMAGAARGATVPPGALRALEWLEGLPPPAIAAPPGVPGQEHTRFVPINDIDAALSARDAPDLEKAVAAVRVGEAICPILFDADAPLLYCWSMDGGSAQAAALCEAAGRLYQLGRGIDMAWAEASVVSAEVARTRLSDHGGMIFRPAARGHAGKNFLCPRPGTTRSLAARHTAARNRFRASGTNRKPARVFVQPPKPVLDSISYNAPSDRLLFELREGGVQSGVAAQELKTAARLVQDVRDKVAARLCEAVPALASDVERYLIGRGATDADKALRVRIVPVPSFSRPQADTRIRQLAVYVPQSCPLRADDLAWAFAQVRWIDSGGAVTAELRRVGDGEDLVGGLEHRGRGWHSVTPLALRAERRHRKGSMPPTARGGKHQADEEARVAGAVRLALRHARIVTPPADVNVQREPFDMTGERAESFAAGTRFPADAMWHARIQFTEPVAGPLLLGDGRYLGLGLMLPDERVPGVLAFRIAEGLAEAADPLVVARAARRAMMARAQECLPRGRALPLYVSGHEGSGGGARDGAHRHIAVFADLRRRRLLYVAPSRLHRGEPDWREFSADHAFVENALAGMRVLRAGTAGSLILAPMLVDAETDPLFAAARRWESVTEYRVARHRRRLTDEEALRADVAAELRRIGWPMAEDIFVQEVRRGRRGGLSGRVRLSFTVAHPGPLAIGRTAHKGGGLFAGCP